MAPEETTHGADEGWVAAWITEIRLNAAASSHASIESFQMFLTV